VKNFIKQLLVIIFWCTMWFWYKPSTISWVGSQNLFTFHTKKNIYTRAGKLWNNYFL